MWHWDQGHLEYFQFDALRQLASYVQKHDFKKADRSDLLVSTGLRFAAPVNYTPWRNYSRVLKLMLLVSEQNNVAIPTPVANIISIPGAVTCDEYLHFILRAFTEPSPALKDWKPNASFRYPLLFAIKYLLAKTVISSTPIASLDEILGAYLNSGYDGGEEQEEFIAIIRESLHYENIAKNSQIDCRQAKESLKVISQISYLHIHSDKIIVSLNQADAHEIFDDLAPISGPRASDNNSEIIRLASLFKDGSTSITFDYPSTTIEAVVESGFNEGNKVKKTHITIERNSGLRREYFSANPITVCDLCTLDTYKTYPWTERVLDIHHLLPLCSGTRVEGRNTTFKDLVPICPTCHRAVHRFYDRWLGSNNREDFIDGNEAKHVYQELKAQFSGLIL